MRFNILAVPHTVSTAEYSSCAFSTKVVKLCRMLKMAGHHVTHYGNEASVVECDEHVTVTTAADLEQSYPGHDWRKDSFPTFSTEDTIYKTFTANCIEQIRLRAKPGDFLLCPFGHAHKPVADAFPDMAVVESGVGYGGGTFAPYKVYESYSVMHALYGQSRVASMFNDAWFDCVIPNAYDPADFTFSDEKDDYILFLGRIGPGKGFHIASDLVQRIGGKLVVAGPGYVDPAPHVEAVGVVGPVERAKLLSRAKATICASMYLEPFCGVQIESMLSGTPVISTDWGAFAEYNLHGVTGYRCRTMEQFTWAARNIGRITPIACRKWAAENFSLDRVAQQYDEYFWAVKQIHGGQGWYQPNSERRELNWLRQRHPLEWST